MTLSTDIRRKTHIATDLQPDSPGGRMESHSNQGQVTIRDARESDPARIANLAAQLGYHATAKEVGDRLSLLSREPERNAIFVAELPDQRVVGWVHAIAHMSLITEMRAEITALVVDEAERGKGIGRALMANAERWAISRGLSLVRLSSQTKRTDAHRFYEGLGYEIQKTSHVLTKRLPVDSGATFDAEKTPIHE